MRLVDSSKSVNVAKAEALVRAATGESGSLGPRETPTGMLWRVSAGDIAKNVSRLTHARICYLSGMCSAWQAFLTLFGFGPEPIGDTYEKILFLLGVSENNVRLLSAESLTFTKIDKPTGQFVFLDQRGREVVVSNLDELNGCVNLTVLTINTAPIREIDLSGLIMLTCLNLACCEGLEKVVLPGERGIPNYTLERINVSSTAITEVDISNLPGVRHFFANTCPNLHKINAGPKNGAVQSIQACDNPALREVNIQYCQKCTAINLRDCERLECVIHPTEFDGVSTIHLQGCPALSPETRASLSKISTGKYVHMDEGLRE
ncbi:MAG: hypothetical protein LBB26_02455 [Puniceicoccales bacterium]|jgi:hypothetical protein|nr:hypothetical protein [Puniceicoccales bacterium]